MKVAKKTRTCAKAPSNAARAKTLKVSASARYALRILMDVALHAKGGEPRTEKAIAARQGISMKFLSRIVIPLRRAKLLSAKQGSRGGFALVKEPEEITLLDIIETVQGSVGILDCLDPSVGCGRKRTCSARRIWAKANAGIREALASITLADAL